MAKALVPPCSRCGTRLSHEPGSACAEKAREFGLRAGDAHPDLQAQGAVAMKFLASVMEQPKWVREDLSGFYAAACTEARLAVR